MTDAEIEEAFAYAATYDSDLPIYDAAITLQAQLRDARDEIKALRAEVDALRKENWRLRKMEAEFLVIQANEEEMAEEIFKTASQRDSLRDQLQRVTEERDAWRETSSLQAKTALSAVERAVEDDTAEAIAAWLDYMSSTVSSRIARTALESAAEAIRAGAWRGKGEP